MKRKGIKFLCIVLSAVCIMTCFGQRGVGTYEVNAATSASSTSSTDMSKYLVFTKENWKNDKPITLTKYYNKDNPNTDASATTGRVYHYYPKSGSPELVNVYEFTKRPSFAGKARTVTLSDKDLLPENLIKLNLQVGDTVITKSFTYEQDGNTKNGQEPIEWKIEKVQIIYTYYGTKLNFADRKFKGQGANISASYYMVAKKTLDYDEYFKFENYTQLYTGTSLTSQKYANSYMKKPSNFEGFVFDSLQGADIDFTIASEKQGGNLYWNTCNTTAYTGMVSLYKFADKSAYSKPTAYALSKGIPTTPKGYAKYNWLFGGLPYVMEGMDDIALRGLSVKYDGKLRWNHPFTDKSGFRPEMTLWTGVDTAAAHTKYDLTLTQLQNGSWEKTYKINSDIWKSLKNFVTWKIN